MFAICFCSICEDLLEAPQLQAGCDVKVDSLPRWMMLEVFRYELWRATTTRCCCLKASFKVIVALTFIFILFWPLCQGIVSYFLYALFSVLCSLTVVELSISPTYCPPTLCEPFTAIAESVTPELPLFSWIPSREESALLWLNDLISSAVLLAGRWQTVKGIVSVFKVVWNIALSFSAPLPALLLMSSSF